MVGPTWIPGVESIPAPIVLPYCRKDLVPLDSRLNWTPSTTNTTAKMQKLMPIWQSNSARCTIWSVMMARFLTNGSTSWPPLGFSWSLRLVSTSSTWLLPKPCAGPRKWAFAKQWGENVVRFFSNSFPKLGSLPYSPWSSGLPWRPFPSPTSTSLWIWAAVGRVRFPGMTPPCGCSSSDYLSQWYFWQVRTQDWFWPDSVPLPPWKVALVNNKRAGWTSAAAW